VPQVPQIRARGALRRALDAVHAPVGWISFLDGGVERLEGARRRGFAELPAEQSLALAATPAAALFIDDARADRGATTRWWPRPARALRRARAAGSRGDAAGRAHRARPVAAHSRRSERTALANLALARGARSRRSERHGAMPQRRRPGAGCRGAGRAPRAEIAAAAAPSSSSSRARAHRRGARQPRAARSSSSRRGAMLRWNASLAAAIGYPTRRSAP
jgi:hypothetical protein